MGAAQGKEQDYVEDDGPDDAESVRVAPALTDRGSATSSDASYDLRAAFVYSEREERVRSIDVAPDGSAVVYADEGGHLCVLDAASGKEIVVRSCPPQALEAVRWSPCGRWLATGGFACAVHVFAWSASAAAEPAGAASALSSEPVATLVGGHKWHIVALDWRKDAAYLVSCDFKGRMAVWQWDTAAAAAGAPCGTLVCSLTLHRHGGALSVRWSGLRHLAVSTDANHIAVYELDDASRTAHVLHIGKHVADGSVVRGVAWRGDGKALVSVGDDNCIVLWRVGDGELAGERAFQLDNGESLVDMHLSPSGRWLAVGCESGRTLVFDLDDGCRYTVIPCSLWRNSGADVVRWSQDECRLVVGHFNGSVALFHWPFAKWTPRAHWRYPPRFRAAVRTMLLCACAPDIADADDSEASASIASLPVELVEIVTGTLAHLPYSA